MTFKNLLFVVVAGAATLPALPAFAQGLQEYDVSQTRGATVANAQRLENQAPGNTNELSSDAKESATGGPSGGLGRGGAAGGN